ncbi:MAG TPA: cbb3-type cytochrome c oxidase subunit I [Anaerolineaceae bacterium]|nr:cbb3-type cytochrome c oxidase subunit I [Anaerolineaceae bacterium]
MKKILSVGLVRGLLAQIIGTAVGMGIVGGIRALMGLPWKTEPALVLGAFIGALSFVAGVGVFHDWFEWAMGRSTPEESEDEGQEDQLKWYDRYLGPSTDHKVIGIQYGTLSLILLGLGGTFALIFRSKLVVPGSQMLALQQFNTLIGMHGMGLIISILLGFAAMGNYLVPLLIGAKDMAFPRLNAFGFWIAAAGSIIFLNSLVLGGFDTGWTAYPPLSIRAPLGMQTFFVGVFLNGLSSIVGSLNFIVTIMRLRTKGMNLFRIPIFVWGILATSFIALTATQLIGLSFQMVSFERLFGMGFFDPANGGNPILFQYLFWFYSHPAVYIFVLPGLGVISELLPVFARKPLFGYRWVALSSMGIAITGFLVFAHHMYASGMDPYLRVPFMYSTLLVAVPTGVKFFSWVGTIWEGKISFPTPMLFVLGGVLVFLLGGLTGPVLGTISTDLHLTDTYFVVGHFHATMFGGYIFPVIAAIHYWFPKITGRRMNETLGKLQFWLMTPAFFVMSLGQMWAGLLGMRRRIADYDPALGIQPIHIAITIAGFLIGLSVLIFFINIIRSARHGEVATGNVWASRSPEWQVPSPMPLHNYAHPFEVVGEPYDYGLEGSVYVVMDPKEGGQPGQSKATGPAGPRPLDLNPSQAGD